MKVRHLPVYGSEGTYAGWPANHGAWQRGDEMLVGFLCGPWEFGGVHNIREPFQKLLARSVDAGETWTIDRPNVDFEAGTVSSAPPLDLRSDIIRACGTYDHGGDHCHVDGGFYLSRDFGRTWSGAFAFTGLVAEGFGTMRTAVLPSRRLVFASFAVYGFDDYTICVSHDGSQFTARNVVCSDSYRAAMPSVAEIGQTIYVALRRRSVKAGCWIDLFASDDDGWSWRFVSRVGETGSHNGNPPALIAFDGRLYCAFANRTECTINLACSADGGRSWSVQVIRRGIESDIGYPQLFVRQDGQLVCVYYWSDAGEAQRIEASIVEVQ